MQRKRAFTLIELLVVIAIIAILAAILFPVFAKARERAKQSKSLNNVKQLAIGVITYSQDYNETFPGWVQPTATTFAHDCWDEQINASIKSKDVFHNGDTGIRSYSDPTKQRKVTYGINALLITAPATPFTGNANFTVNAANPPAPLSPSAIGNPAGTILFAEMATSTAMTGDFGKAPRVSPLLVPAPGAGSSDWQGALAGSIDISPRAFIETINNATNKPYEEPYGLNADKGVARDLYGGGGVYAFTDGHVQFMKIGKSVGLGTTVGAAVISTTTCWAPANTNNMWNPQ